MVKAKKTVAAKKTKSEEIPDTEVNADISDVEEIQDKASQENGEIDVNLKKKGRGRSAKTEGASEEDNKDDEVEAVENGDGDTVEKKKPAAKKTKTPKKVVSKPVTEPARKSSRTPKPVTKEGSEEEAYEVEKLVDFRLQRGKPQYLVRWKGYTAGDDTWEEEAHLNCPELLQKYKADNPDREKKAKKRASSKSPVKSAKKTKTKEVEKEDYEVEDIVGMRVKNGKKEFKIRWKGYKASDDSWEPEKHLSCKDLIEKYLADHEDEVEEDEKKSPSKKSKTPAKSSRGRKAKAK